MFVPLVWAQWETFDKLATYPGCNYALVAEILSKKWISVGEWKGIVISK